MAASPHRTITSPPLYLSGWQKVAANKTVWLFEVGCIILITGHKKIELLYNQSLNLRQILTTEITARDIRIILPHHAPGFADEVVVAGAIGVY